MVTKTQPFTSPLIPRVVYAIGQSNLSASVAKELAWEKYRPLESTSGHPIPSGNGSTIVYDTGRQKFNFCNHQSETLVYHGPPPEMQVAVRSGSTFYHYVYGKGASLSPVRPVAPNSAQVTEQLRNEAWNSIYPEINDGFSLANFIFELKDMPALWRAYGKYEYLLKNLKLDKLLQSKTVADVILLYSYALAPLISDLISIDKLVRSINKEANIFVERGKKSQPYHFRKRLEESTQDIKYSYCIKRISQTVDYTATARLSYKYRKPPMLGGLARAWGFRINAENIWNAIPWSFLVDYVVRVGDFLKQFDKDPLVTVSVHDYCDTIKCESKVQELTYRGDKSYPPSVYRVPSGQFEVPVWTWKRSTYLRAPTSPGGGIAFPVLDKLSARELVLGGALLRANIKLTS